MFNLKKIHELSLRNKESIVASENVGCFYCLKISSKSDIIEWVGRGETALCPHCSVDSLLPDNAVCLSDELLKAMREHWFEPHIRENSVTL